MLTNEVLKQKNAYPNNISLRDKRSNPTRIIRQKKAIRPQARAISSSAYSEKNKINQEILSYQISIKKSFFFIGVIFGLLLVKLYIRLEILDMSYKIEQTRNELLMRDSEYREIKAKRAFESNPRRIIEDAKLKHNLRQTTPQQIRYLD